MFVILGVWMKRRGDRYARHEFGYAKSVCIGISTLLQVLSGLQQFYRQGYPISAPPCILAMATEPSLEIDDGHKPEDILSYPIQLSNRPSRSPSSIARITIKNRRKRYLDTHPEYFSSPSLELAGLPYTPL